MKARLAAKNAQITYKLLTRATCACVTLTSNYIPPKQALGACTIAVDRQPTSCHVHAYQWMEPTGLILHIME